MDEELLTAHERADKLAAIQMQGDIRNLMGTASGRRLAWYLLSQFGIFSDGFSNDALIMAHSSGRRSCGLQLLQLIEAYAPQQYDKMAKEARDAATTNERTDQS